MAFVCIGQPAIRSQVDKSCLCGLSLTDSSHVRRGTAAADTAESNDARCYDDALDAGYYSFPNFSLLTIF